MLPPPPPPPSVDEISTKLNSLKVYYSATRAKHEAAKVSGNGTDEIPAIKWLYYRLLAFISDSITPRKTLSLT